MLDQEKFEVRLKDDADGNHSDCWLFVLDPAHDRRAFYALLRYAETAYSHGEYAVAEALYRKLQEIPRDFHAR